MSLEEAIRENTVAVRDLIAALRTGTAAPAPEAPAKPAKGKAAKVEAQVAEQNAEASASELPEPAFLKGATNKFEEPRQAANEPVALPYDDVKNAVLAYVKAGYRQQVVDTLGEFKVDRADQLKPEKYQPFLDALRAAGCKTPEEQKASAA